MTPQRRQVALVVVLSVMALVTALLTAPSAAAKPPPGSPVPPVTGGFEGGGVAVGGETGGGQPASPPAARPAGTTTAPVTRTLTCDLTGPVTAACAPAANACLRPPLAPPTNATITQTRQPDGSWRQTGIDCDGTGPTDTIAAVTPALVRQQIVRLLPPVPVGIAPATGPTLVNLETIFWTPTPTTRPLGPVTILGQTVAITIRYHHTRYDYGDGTTAVTTTPGTAWTKTLCTTAQCPTLDGHTYTTPSAALTTHATVTWTATFTVAGGPTQTIPGTIDGPTATHTLQVLEGRSVLVR